jgi:hypothetical protein
VARFGGSRHNLAADRRSFLQLECERGLQMTITVKAARDAEAGVWFIADSDLPGLNLEGENLDELYD